MRSLGVLLLIAGCRFEGSDATDAGADPDMQPPVTHGMSVTWQARPALPGAVTDRITVTSAVFQLEHLQLVSDAGADERTTRSRYQLEWRAGVSPPEEKFPDAPIAVYQRVSLDLRPDVQPPFSYQIAGTWRDEDDEIKQFRIADAGLIDIPIDCDVALQAGGSGSVEVRVDLREALGNVDFNAVQEKDGVLLLLGGPQMMQFRTRLRKAFEIDG